MKMKLFYESNTMQINELEVEVNAFLGTVPTAKIFAVNTASTAHDIGNVRPGTLRRTGLTTSRKPFCGEKHDFRCFSPPPECGVEAMAVGYNRL